MSDKLKVVQFAKRVNENSTAITANEILEGAMNLLETCMVIGREAGGEPFFMSTTANRAEILLMIKELEFDLLTPVFED